MLQKWLKYSSVESDSSEKNKNTWAEWRELVFAD